METAAEGNGKGGVALGEDDLLAKLTVPGAVATGQALVEVEREGVRRDVTGRAGTSVWRVLVTASITVRTAAQAAQSSGDISRPPAAKRW